MHPGFLVRPMQPGDVADVERLSDQAFFDLDVRLKRAGWPAPERRDPAGSQRWRERTEHVVGTDPGGCWVAEDGRGILGAAVSMRRDLTWLLATYAVRPGLQGHGIGRQVLAPALDHAGGRLRGMIVASDDPAAVRHYRMAGFTLHPTMLLRGRVPRAALPVLEGVRDGTAADRDLMDSVDRGVRHAAHGIDHEVLLRHHRLLVVHGRTGSGYAYVTSGGAPALLAATTQRVAADLMWECLAGSDPDEPVTLPHVSAANEWAVDVGMACRLELWGAGYLGLRGMAPPKNYIHHGALG